MKKLFVILLLSFLLVPFLLKANIYQPRRLVSIPTAGILPENTFSSQLYLYRKGGLIARVNIGLFNRFMLGASFGGENILGDGKINWQPQVEFAAKVRVLEEDYSYPALALGFQSQGEGAYREKGERYAIKSKGFYLSASKNFEFLYGNLGFHAGTNFSLERKQEESINFFLGMDKDFKDIVAINLDYDVALNDNLKDGRFGEGYGYLNTSLKYVYKSNIEIEFLLKDILRNAEEISTPRREVRLTFIFPLLEEENSSDGENSSD